MIFVRDIQAATAKHFGVPVEIMRAWDKRVAAVVPRQVAMCLAMRLTEQGPTRIGRLFARDHSTVWSNSRKTEQRCRTDPKISEALRSVTMRLLAEDGR